MSVPDAGGDNYRWWREQAGSWKEEIEARKRHMPIYHLQEILLADLLRRSAPARVLDFGCGYGRHLRYLDRIPDLEVHGFDQSAAMLEQLDWAPPAWREERLRLGDPLGRLPYPDDAFDVVISVSVLIHVRPEDLKEVVGELARVARWQVIHIENNRVHETTQTSTMHDGCWAHDLAGVWAGVPNARFEVLPEAFEAEDVYRVQLDPDQPLPAVEPEFAAQLLELDRSVAGELRRLQEVELREGRRRSALEEQTRDLQGRIGDLRAAVESLEARNLEGLERARDAEAERVRAVQHAQRAAEMLEEALVRTREAEARQAEATQRTREAEVRQAEATQRTREAEARQAAEQARAEKRTASLEGDLREQQREFNWVLAELRKSMGL